jgi:hypothetical protein
MAKPRNTTPQSKALKFTGKDIIRHNDGVLIPGETYNADDMKGDYLQGLIVQGYFEGVAEAENSPSDNSTKPLE